MSSALKALSTILHINIASLSTNLKKLIPLVDTFDPDIIGLNETQINNGNDDYDTLVTKTHTFDKNCHVMKRRKSNNGPPISGTSVYTCSKSCKVEFECSPNEFEIISAKISLKSKKISQTIRLIYAYLSPSSSANYVNDFYSKIVTIINNDNKSIEPILIGDLNSKDNRIFPTKSPNYHGKCLYNLINGYPIHTNGPSSRCCFLNNVKYATRYGNKSSNLLDVVLSSTSLGLPITVEHVDQTTDHDALVIQIFSPDELAEDPAEKTLRIYDYEQTNFNELHQAIISIRNNITKDLENEDIDLNEHHRRYKRNWNIIINQKNKKKAKCLASFNNYDNLPFRRQKLDILIREMEYHLREAFNKHVPNKTFVTLDLDRSSVLFPSDLKAAYKHRSKLYHRLRASGSSPTSNCDYVSVSKSCSELHSDFITNWYNSLILPGRSNSREFYSKTRFLLGKTETKRAIVVKDEWGRLGNTKDAAKSFAYNFSKKLKDNHNKNVSKKFKPRKIEFPPEPFTSDYGSFIKALKSINNKISCGFDEINNRLLKLCKPAMASLLNVISTEIFQLSHWPTSFKSAKSIVLYKKDDPHDCNNFRVIALLSSISKVIEKVLLEQILSHFNSNKLFYIRQAGYRTDNSCDDITCDLVDEILINRENKFLQSILFIDYTGAFDFMSIERLVIKLYGYRFLNSQVKLLESYLTNRSFKFVVNGHTSKNCWLSSGCSQGSCLGPVLFLIFINDLPDVAQMIGLDYLFADDLGAMNKARDAKQLSILTQNSAKRIEDWSNRNNCIVSIKKTKVMYIGNGDFGPIKIYGKNLEVVDRFKYLGNVLDNKLNGQFHLEKIQQKVNSSLAIVRGLTNKLSLEKLLQITQTFTYPNLTYGFKAVHPLMNKTTQDEWEKLSLEVQRVSLRAPRYCSPHIVSKMSSIPSLSQSIKRSLTRESEKIIYFGKSNSLTQKMTIKIPSQDNKRRKVHVQPSHKKSGITVLADHINSAKITEIDEPMGLYEEFRPKMTPQVIEPKFSPADRIAIRNLSLGILSRLKMSSLNSDISKYCTDCLRSQKTRKYIEDTPHIIKCSSQGQTLYENAAKTLKIIIDRTNNRLNTSSMPIIINQCQKLIELTIFDDLTDIILGIGKVQAFKPVCNKKYKIVVEQIFNLQKSLIPILKSKDRLYTTFSKRSDSLFRDQASVPFLSK